MLLYMPRTSTLCVQVHPLEADEEIVVIMARVTGARTPEQRCGEGAGEGERKREREREREKESGGVKELEIQRERE